MSFENVIVQKKWGSEYLLYENDKCEIWHLRINYGHRTSLHAHPNKKTGLIVVGGQCKLSFIGNSIFMETGNKVMLRNGVFHQTTSLAHPYAELLEIETPKNKNDIVRLEDDYGRAGKPYEGADSYKESTIPVLGDRPIIVGTSKVQFYKLVGYPHFDDTDKIIVLDGRIYFQDFDVLAHGDIVDGKTFNMLWDKFDHTTMEILIVTA